VEANSVEPIAGRIESFLETLLAPRGLFVVDIVMRGRKGQRVLEVFIDGDEGVTTADCAGVSRLLSKELDERLLQGEEVTLTVSSPGLDRPLRYPRQYAKHVGREILLDLRTAEGTNRVGGTLVESDSDGIAVLLKKGDDAVKIPYADIIGARIKPRW